MKWILVSAFWLLSGLSAWAAPLTLQPVAPNIAKLFLPS